MHPSQLILSRVLKPKLYIAVLEDVSAFIRRVYLYIYATVRRHNLPKIACLPEVVHRVGM